MLANFQKFQQLEGLTFKIGLSISKSHKTFIINMYSGRALLSPRRDTSAFVPRRPIERLPSRKKHSLIVLRCFVDVLLTSSMGMT